MAWITGISTSDYTVTINFDNGETLTIDPANAGIIKQQLLLEELRSGIRNVVDDEIGSESMDFSRGDVTREAFENEIYEDLEDEITCGDYTALCDDGDWIREKVTDLAACYGLDNDDCEEK